MKVALGALLTGLALCRSMPAQSRDPMDGLRCVSSLELPTHGLFAARAPSSGTVSATFEVAPGGTVSKLQLSTEGPPHDELGGEVRVALDGSRFAERCVGRHLTFVFSFTLQDDPPTDSILPPTVRFLPPNRFELVFRRVKPNF